MPQNMRKANWIRNMIDGCLNQASGPLRFLTAPIESGYELIDALPQAGTGYLMASAWQIAFQISNYNARGRQQIVDFLNR